MAGRSSLRPLYEPRCLTLVLALSDNARTQPVIARRCAMAGTALDIEVLHPSEMFWRQLHKAEFDVCEMSLASLMIAARKGDQRFVAIPVFTMRKFFHTGILVRSDAGIQTPLDLRGKRVGVPEYQQSSAIWSRGVLADHYGVSPEQIEWFMERGPDKSHGAATGFTPPPGVTVRQIPPDQDIGLMLLSGELDATLLYLNDRNRVDRSRADLDASLLVRPMFNDVAAEEARYFAATGFVPINHVLVAKRELLAAHPDLAGDLFAMFDKARAMAEGQGAQPTHYGLTANRAPLETLARYVHAQGLTAQPISLDMIFDPQFLIPELDAAHA